MAKTFPYAYYACPCSDVTSDSTEGHGTTGDDPESTFDPHDPRSAYALNALDQLLFCDDCNQIKCNRCINEEVLNWYCPNCLFETHSTGVRADGNRCSRNCYNCPVCTSTAIVVRSSALQSSSSDESYILLCQYCNWTSLQVDLQFSRPNKISEQLNQIRKASQASDPAAETENTKPGRWAHDARFTQMLNFYRDQLTNVNDLPGRAGSGAYGSPSNLARIIHMYGGLSHKSLAPTQDKPRSMREANVEDGLSIYTAQSNDHDRDNKAPLHTQYFEQTTSSDQRDYTPLNDDVRYTSALWPAATKLRTRRGKRCRQCRQFVVRPETKTTAMRYKIRILARNHIPRLEIRPLLAGKPAQHPAFVLRSENIAPETVLQPLQTYQYVLTLRNPIFESVKITLATPGITPGRLASRVTILCPSFVLGPAGDVWEDALSGSGTSVGDGSRRAAMASLTGSSETDRQPEAGKVWEQTRNSTSVVLEVITGAPENASTSSNHEGGPLSPDDCTVEIPISIHAEWTAEETNEQGQKGKPEAKELQYWCVVGIGRVTAHLT